MKKDTLQVLGRFGPRLPLSLLFGAFATEIACRILALAGYSEVLPLNSIRLLATLTSWTSILIVIFTCSRLSLA